MFGGTSADHLIIRDACFLIIGEFQKASAASLLKESGWHVACSSSLRLLCWAPPLAFALGWIGWST
jgi:hypothetical protein